jgi:Cft2 family RNA processing exonuclease
MNEIDCLYSLCLILNVKILLTDFFFLRNMFDFKHIQPFEKVYADRPGPMVVFATPGMLHAGMSLDVFKKWAGDERNMVILPGYCVAGTVGAKVLAGQKVVSVYHIILSELVQVLMIDGR